MGIGNIIREIKREHLIAPNRRGIIQRIRRRTNRNKQWLKHSVNIFLITRCNLNCYSCRALGMETKPPAVTTDLIDIERFLGHMKQLYPNTSVLLTGGEPTMYPLLPQVCDLVHSYGFKVSLLTNGFKVFPPELFDLVLLDYHGVNKDDIAKWKTMLVKSNTAWHTYMKQYHQDIPFAMKDNITRGARCPSWLKQPTLLQNVVYPCCNMMSVEWWHDTEEVTVALRKAGWTVDNPNLVETMKSWRETLPAEVYRLCTLKCWQDSSRAKWVEIS